MAEPQITVKLVNTVELAGLSILLEAEASARPEGGYLFEGETAPGEEIKLGELAKELATELVGHFPSLKLPEALETLVATRVGMSFDTGTKELGFDCEVKLTLGDREVDAVAILRLIHDQGAYSAKVTLGIRLGADGPVLDLEVSTDPKQQSLVADLGAHKDQKLGLSDLLAAVSPDFAHLVPPALDLGIEDGVFALVRDAAGTRALLGIDLGFEADLSALPLVGECLPTGTRIGLENPCLWAATGAVDGATIGALKKGFPDTTTLLPGGGTGLDVGVRLSASFAMGGAPSPISIDFGGGAGGTQAGDSTGETGAKGSSGDAKPASGGKAKWFNLQRRLGPVSFQRVGFLYDDGELRLLLDAALSLGGLTLSVEGLAAGVVLAELDPPKLPTPRFHLEGVAVDFKRGPLEVAGGLLESGGEFDGMVILRTEEIGVAALGSYKEIHQADRTERSIFVYGVLDEPLGGPAFCFVTGLAAGFGYNRSLTAPGAGEVEKFPLVEVATGAQDPGDLAEMLGRLRGYVTPAAGDDFLAVGIKFTSFKLIDSFALLTAVFGEKFELDVIGLSTLMVPPAELSGGETPLAEIQMGLVARFVPEDGFLGVTGGLTSASYVLSRKCRLSGGFAFSTWFSGEHEGDFVQTMGGYHPHFKVPGHYPRVPRLGISWKVDHHTSIKGQAYYALVPSAMMAGGKLEATWKSGHFSASLTAGADFMIGWQPYHYDASMHVGVKGAYTHHTFLGTIRITAHIGAHLHIWGPEFAGKAHIDLDIVSFDVKFGSGSSGKPKPISWAAFRKLLPETDKACTVSVRSGLLRTLDGRWVVNPKELVLATDSAIPVKRATGNGVKLYPPASEGQAPPAVGISPMDVADGKLTSRLTITIEKREPTSGWTTYRDFDYFNLTKSVPAAMWGTSFGPDPAKGVVEDTLSGFEIRPKPPGPPDVTRPIERAKLAFSEGTPRYAGAWRELAEPPPTGVPTRRLKEPAMALRKALQNPIDIDLKELSAGDFYLPGSGETSG